MSSKKAKSEMPTEAQAQMADQVANFAQKTVDQAQAAFEKVTEVAHGNVQILDAAANAYKNRVTDIHLKAMEFAQLNMNAGFAFARKFVAVRDPAEALSLQQSFFKDQAETMQRQVSELGELSVALAKESLKPVQESVTKSLASFSKAAA
ncbi:phasin family protein [Aestuariivirga sp.]|uniref:phasin family protein n=1 Tax=Aestuariivirga sp. TaxID=2650926 RepID=UPI0039193F32